MLARAVPEAAVLVSPDRYLAGRLAESRLGRSIHVLDDGFQHLSLSRNVDLLVTPPDDVRDVRTLPFGRFRESLEAATAADALLVPVGQVRLKPDATDVRDIADDMKADMARRLGVAVAFGFERSLGDARLHTEPGERVAAGSARAYAVAGIATPDRFFSDLERAGWQVVGRQRFRDHHRYSSGDVQGIGRRARQSGADVILMTEKDSVRWPVSGLLDVPIASVPLRVVIEPGFQAWLTQRVADARRRVVA
jgi:tetraacyldisaccharide 4'-kinase